jgi:hypothetical protein
MKQKLMVLFATMALGLLTAAVANAQSATAKFEITKKSGYTLSISFTVKSGTVRSVSVNETTPINKSFHERGVEGTRGDDASTWTDTGNVTTIESDGMTVSVTRRPNGFLITMDWSSVKVLFTKAGAKYVGHIVK